MQGLLLEREYVRKIITCARIRGNAAVNHVRSKLSSLNSVIVLDLKELRKFACNLIFQPFPFWSPFSFISFLWCSASVHEDIFCSNLSICLGRHGYCLGLSGHRKEIKVPTTTRSQARQGQHCDAVTTRLMLNSVWAANKHRPPRRTLMRIRWHKYHWSGAQWNPVLPSAHATHDNRSYVFRWSTARVWRRINCGCLWNSDFQRAGVLSGRTCSVGTCDARWTVFDFGFRCFRFYVVDMLFSAFPFQLCNAADVHESIS